MANGHVEIHDPFPNHYSRTGSTDRDPEPPSDTESMDGTVEYRLMMAYATRRRPKNSHAHNSPVAVNDGRKANGTPSQTPIVTEKEVSEEKKKPKRRKKKGWKRLPSIFRCVKPQTEDEPEPQQPTAGEPDDDMYRCMAASVEVKEEDALGEVASRLAEIADDVPFVPPELETDSEENDVEKMIGLLLREAGDRLHEKELKDANIATELFWNYSFFESLITALLTKMGLRSADPDAPGPHASPKTQIAVTCEVTSRLSAVDTLPMNRLLNHGARYLQNYYSSWAQQQGGYEAAFESDEDEVQ